MHVFGRNVDNYTCKKIWTIGPRFVSKYAQRKGGRYFEEIVRKWVGTEFVKLWVCQIMSLSNYEFVKLWVCQTHN
jgi:hypothetical protein